MAFLQREGPLPPPAELQAYHDIAPYIGITVVQMAKDAADHRHRIESQAPGAFKVLVCCITLVLLALVAGATVIAIQTSLLVGVLIGTVPTGILVWIANVVRKVMRQARQQDQD